MTAGPTVVTAGMRSRSTVLSVTPRPTSRAPVGSASLGPGCVTSMRTARTDPTKNCPYVVRLSEFSTNVTVVIVNLFTFFQIVKVGKSSHIRRMFICFFFSPLFVCHLS